MNPAALLVGVLLPAAVAGAIFFAAWGLGSKAARADASAPAPAAAIAIGAAGMAGFGQLFGWQFLPRESWLWLLWVFPLAGLLGAVEAREGIPATLRFGLRLTLVAGALALVLRKVLWSTGGELQWQKLAIYGAVPLLLASLWRALLTPMGAVVGAGVLWLLTSATAAMLLFAGSLKLAQASGTAAAALGALAVACWLRPSPRGMAGAITPVAVVLSMLVFLGIEYGYAEYSPWLFALIALAPMFGASGLVRRHWARLFLIAIPVGIAVALAFRTYDTSAL